jgi:hypothetical protein
MLKFEMLNDRAIVDAGILIFYFLWKTDISAKIIIHFIGS